MKKLLLLFIISGCTATAFAQQSAPAKDTSVHAPETPVAAAQPISVSTQPHKYMIALTQQDLTLLGQVIDASTASHVNVTALLKTINDQLIPQMQPPAPVNKPRQ